MSRRLPVYLLIDSSGSMRGEPIHAVNVGISSMLEALRQDPYALESVYLSLITFDNNHFVCLSHVRFVLTNLYVDNISSFVQGGSSFCISFL